MGHKIPKLTFLGPQDSGKSTWYEILLAFVCREDLAFIGHEKNFPLSMLNEDTKLVIMDDWSNEKIVVDVLKQVFQGGILAIAEKYKGMRTCQSKCPFYITSNKLPNFGDHHDAILARLAVFETKSMPMIDRDLHKWYRPHAMECVHFMANEISKYRFYIQPQELFYESATLHNPESTRIQAELDKIRNLPYGSLIQMSTPKPHDESLHQSFIDLVDELVESEAEDKEDEIEIQASEVEVINQDEQVALVCDSILKSIISQVMLEEAIVRRKRERVDSDDDERLYKRTFNAAEMNSYVYFQSVYRHIIFLSKHAQDVHLLSFRSKQRRLQTQRYLIPDIDYDAWGFICMSGRHVFDSDQFIKCYPEASGVAADIMVKLDISVSNRKLMDEELWM